MKTCAKCGAQFEWINRAGKRCYCKPCYSAYQVAWRRAHPAATQAAKRKWRESHPEEVREAKRKAYHRQLEKSREQQRLWRKANPEKIAQRNLMMRQRISSGVGYGFYKYGLTTEEKAAILAAQGGGCAICGVPDAGSRPAVDHDHACCSERYRRTCGKCVRGVLCQPCNFRLGWYEKHAATIAAYLAAPKRASAPPTGRNPRRAT